MSTESIGPSFDVLGFLGLLVVGGGLGFVGYMATRPGTISGLVEAVATDLHLVSVSLFVIVFGVAMALYYHADRPSDW